MSKSPTISLPALSDAIQRIGGPTKAAKLLDVSVQAVRFYRDGERYMPERFCAKLELALGGAVTRRELMPYDWHWIWPELKRPGEVVQVDIQTADA